MIATANEWRAELASRIAEIKAKVARGEGSYGDDDILLGPSSVRPEDIPFRTLVALMGTVNRGEFAGAETGRLLFVEFDTSGKHHRGAEVSLFRRFSYRRDRPWNHAPDPETGGFVEIQDSAGATLYPEADFGLIP